MRRTYLVIATVIVALLGLGGPAWADPPDDPPPLTTVEGGARAGGNGALANGVYCYGVGNPEPQVSGVTLHYGGVVHCTTVGTIWFKVQLYTVGPAGEIYPDVSFEKVGVGSDLGDTRTTRCLGSAATKWTMAMYATFNGVHFTPYPGTTRPITLPCE